MPKGGEGERPQEELTPQVTQKQSPQPTESRSSSRITDGRFESPARRFINRVEDVFGLNTKNREQNFHNVITREFIINGKRRNVELVHQVRAGDCVLANFLNTASVEFDGNLPATIKDAREFAIRRRQAQGRDIRDIVTPDSPLDYGDVVNLFSLLYGQQPTQEDVLTVEGRDKSRINLQLDALNLLEYLDTYKSGLCTIDLGFHSRTIKKLQGDNYVIIDPMNENGIKFKDTAQMVDFLSHYMANHPDNENFFFFIRNEKDRS